MTKSLMNFGIVEDINEDDEALNYIPRSFSWQRTGEGKAHLQV